MKYHSLHVATLVSVIGIALTSACAHAAGPDLQRDRLRFHPTHVAPAYQFRVIAPNGSTYEDTFLANEPIRLSSNQVRGGWVDGIYSYEITPMTGVNVRSESQAGGGDTGHADSGAESGTFRIQNGAVYLSTDVAEPQTIQSAASAKNSLTSAMDVVALDQVIADDLIVQGSACAGLDCVNGESFGFDTLRLKENNTRIKFDDTSAQAGFPATDWQLTANDSASGGQNKFSIEDVTAGKVPFTVTGNAPTNSIFVASTGKVGLRTATPVLDVHISTSDTPAIRMEQTSAGGFTAQTWDVAGNEANFFVRDVTSGSRLPFRIRPGAPTSSVDIAASGNLGVGTASPGQALDVARNGDVTVRLSNTSVSGFTNDWDIRNNNATGRLTFTDDPAGARVPFKFAPSAVDNLLRVGVLATNTVDINGNLVVTGTITPDYVFEKDFALPSIKDHANAMWANRHLPKMTPALVNQEGKGVINVGERAQGMLEELEYAHIYIEQLHDGLTDLQQEMTRKDDEIMQMREEIAAIKAGVLEAR